MNPTASQTLRRDRPENRPADRQRPAPADERLRALSDDLVEAFARIARRRF